MKKLFLINFIIVIFFSACNSNTKNVSEIKRELSNETIEFSNRLKSLVNKGIMYGHQDDIIYGHSWKTEGESDVKQVTGDYPAVFGWELGHVENNDPYSLDSVLFSEIRAGIKWVHKEGGINTISWHLDNPLTNDNSWDVSSNKVVESILNDGDINQKYIQMMDNLAEFLLSLKDDNNNLIPIIFRPFHEHTGSWFWWGEDLCSSEDYIELWRITVDYLTEKGLNNILYAYSSAGNFDSAEKFLEKYPGDDIIDIIGFDIYQFGADDNLNYIESTKSMLEILTPIAEEKGIITILAETGYESIPDATWWTETLWPAIKDYKISYVLTWRNAHDREEHYYAPFPGQISAQDFIEFKENVLFLNDIKQ